MVGSQKPLLHMVLAWLIYRHDSRASTCFPLQKNLKRRPDNRQKNKKLRQSRSLLICLIE